MANSASREGKVGTSELPDALLWVKDAPLFIDDENLSRFYDAVVRPAFKEGPLTIKVSESRKKELEGKLGGKGKVGLPSWLASIFSGELEVSAEGKASGSKGEGSENTIIFAPIETPQRQLEQLMIFYLLNQPERLLVGGLNAPLEWQKTGKSAAVPRALAFVDLPAGTKFVPMAAEFNNGKVVTLHDKFTAASGERPPAFKRDERHSYWGFFAKHFDSVRVTTMIEEASRGNGKIDWIDFRVPLNDKVEAMHLHMEAHGRYYTGALAYMIVNRSVGHGMRLIGTLKDGPAINVLALYEK